MATELRVNGDTSSLYIDGRLGQGYKDSSVTVKFDAAGRETNRFFYEGGSVPKAIESSVPNGPAPSTRTRLEPPR